MRQRSLQGGNAAPDEKHRVLHAFIFRDVMKRKIWISRFERVNTQSIDGNGGDGGNNGNGDANKILLNRNISSEKSGRREVEKKYMKMVDGVSKFSEHSSAQRRNRVSCRLLRCKGAEREWKSVYHSRQDTPSEVNRLLGRWYWYRMTFSPSRNVVPIQQSLQFDSFFPLPSAVAAAVDIPLVYFWSTRASKFERKIEFRKLFAPVSTETENFVSFSALPWKFRSCPE